MSFNSNPALALLQWIRGYKKHIAATTLPADQQNSENEKALADIRDTLASFDRAYRGATNILSGRDRPGHRNEHMLYHARHAARHVLEALLEKMPILTGPGWNSLFNQHGLADIDFQAIAQSFFGRKLDKELAAFPNASWERDKDGALVLLLKNGNAENRLTYDYPYLYDSTATLGQQFEALRQQWKRLREELRTSLKNGKKWPTDADAERAKRARAHALAMRLFGSTTKTDRELLLAYPDILTQALKHPYRHYP